MKPDKRVKIVCTIGPASEKPHVLRAMIQAGMNAARVNLSHGDLSAHQRVIKLLREISKELGMPLAVIADIPGGLRTGKLKEGEVILREGDEVTIVKGDRGSKARVPINYKLSSYLHPGSTILLDDGAIELEVLKTQKGEIKCLVKNTGVLGECKGVNIPSLSLPLPLDERKIEFAAEMDVDYIAASFIRDERDIQRVHEVLDKTKGDEIEVIAKIETRQALENLTEIIQASDGLMVARGDLGVEIEAWEVPLVQKDIVRRCNEAGKPVIIATQMLKSMVESPRPTRAEVADVANAILDGTDAIMLSEETAVGNYPVEAVEMMSRIAYQIEETELPYFKKQKVSSVAEAIGESAYNIAERIGAAAIIPSTRSGATAKLVAKFRPKTKIVAVTYSDKVMNKLALVWGVYPIKVDFYPNTDLMISRSIEAAVDARLIRPGERVVITAGMPFGIKGTTNLIKVEKA
jgi:pyruvate kinase